MASGSACPTKFPRTSHFATVATALRAVCTRLVETRLQLTAVRTRLPFDKLRAGSETRLQLANNNQLITSNCRAGASPAEPTNVGKRERLPYKVYYQRAEGVSMEHGARSEVIGERLEVCELRTSRTVGQARRLPVQGMASGSACPTKLHYQDLLTINGPQITAAATSRRQPHCLKRN
jgi:hypothetical protein